MSRRVAHLPGSSRCRFATLRPDRCNLSSAAVLLQQEPSEEVSLVEQATQALQADLDQWTLTSAPRAVAYAASLLGSSSQAEDVVQDCFCRLLQKAAEYDLLRDGTRLLFRAITNACINLTTRRKPTCSLNH